MTIIFEIYSCLSIWKISSLGLRECLRDAGTPFLLKMKF